MYQDQLLRLLTSRCGDVVVVETSVLVNCAYHKMSRSSLQGKTEAIAVGTAAIVIVANAGGSAGCIHLVMGCPLDLMD